jgi:DNA-binding HxlR family transcriptional regulator
MSENTTMIEEPSELPDEARCYCRLGGLMDLLSRKHAMQVVCAVGALEPVRYGELEDAFGDVSSSTLSARLADLTDIEVLAREQYDEIPPRVEYRLTAEGRELAERLGPLLEWVHARDGPD